MEKDVKHIHLLGICGTGMGSLAGLLLEKGYKVTGTDQAIYPPMSTQLENLGIKPSIGFDPKNLEPKPDLVVVGNVISKDNPEMLSVIDKKILYLSMPQLLSNLFIEGKDSIVVTGTHGKTTTANLVSWLLDHAGTNPGFMIGGVGINFGKSYRYTDSKYFVVEGDEYDTAFFDKGPKFLHYRPKYAIISSIEFDHADIYKNLDHIKESFTNFLKIIPEDGICAVNKDSKEIKSIIHHAKCRVVTYGFSEDSDYIISRSSLPQARSPDNIRFDLTHNGKGVTFETPLAGRHNLMNASSALALLLEMGLKESVLADGLKCFKGVKRRQEIRGVADSITVIDDFAHHPTAIRETISAIKDKYKSGRLFAIFEPRSNTTRRKVFEKELGASFDKADVVVIANVFNATKIPEKERLCPETVVNSINDNGGDAHFFEKTDLIIEYVTKNALPNDTVLIMSNGSFDNIHERLLKLIGRQHSKKWEI